MSLDRKQKVVLATASAFVSLAVFIAGYELIKGYQYDRWREQLAANSIPEGALTLTIPSDNTALLWEYRSNHHYVDKRRNVVISTNEWGFREREDLPLAKPPDVLRVAFLGDSVTLGQTVSAEATLVQRFDSHARAVFPRTAVEALNFGIDGYNTLQILELLKVRVVAFEPDVVVYVMCLNDFDFDGASGGKTRYFRRPRSFFLGALETVYQRLLGRDYHVYYFEKNKKHVFRAVTEARDLLRSKGMALHVALVPVFPKSDKSFEEYGLRSLHREVTQTLRKSSVTVTDLLTDFTEDGKSPRSYGHDIWHPNDEGNELIARSLVGPVLLP